MINETLKARLRVDRAMTSVTVRIPEDVVESMKRIAPLKGFSGYQALLKWYLAEGLRKDEAEFADLSVPADVVIDAMRRHGLDLKTLTAVRKELQGRALSIPSSITDRGPGTAGAAEEKRL